MENTECRVQSSDLYSESMMVSAVHPSIQSVLCTLNSVLSFQCFHPALEHIRRGDGIAEEAQGFPQGVVIAVVIGH